MSHYVKNRDKMSRDLQLRLSEIPEPTAAFFRSVRLRMRLTQHELAVLLQVDRKTISRIENSDARVNARLIYSVLFLQEMHLEILRQYAAVESDVREREIQRLMREREAAESLARDAEKQSEHSKSSVKVLPPSARTPRLKKKRKRR